MRGRSARARLVRTAVPILVLVGAAGAALTWRATAFDAERAPLDPLAEDRAVAVGLWLDTPVTGSAIDAGLATADGLARRYGIDTGDRFEDREEAARRASAELAGVVIREEDLAATARELGYSLDPAICGNTCDNVRRLAELELEIRALDRLAASEPPRGG